MSPIIKSLDDDFSTKLRQYYLHPSSEISITTTGVTELASFRFINPTPSAFMNSSKPSDDVIRYLPIINFSTSSKIEIFRTLEKESFYHRMI